MLLRLGAGTQLCQPDKITYWIYPYWRYVIYRPSIRTVASGVVGVVVVVVGVCNRSQMRTTKVRLHQAQLTYCTVS